MFISGIDKESEQSLNEGLGILDAQASLSGKPINPQRWRTLDVRWMVIKATIEGNRCEQGSKKYVTRYKSNLLKVRLLTGCSAEDSGQELSQEVS